MAILNTPSRRLGCVLGLLVALALPGVLSPFWLHLCNQVALAIVGAVALNLLTGACGQVSLGHAAFLAVGAFTAAIMVQHLGAPFLFVLAGAAAVGATLGLLVGLPSLRFRGLYIAISTLAMHYAILYGLRTYQANLGGSATAGMHVASPSLGPVALSNDRAWYYFLLVVVLATIAAAVNLLRTQPGRAWKALRDRDIAAEALGIHVAYYKLLAFMITSAMTTLAGALLAYFSNVVTSDEFGLELAISYLAMIIVGGLGSVLGAALGATFITLLPHAIDKVFAVLPRPAFIGTQIFSLQFAVLGLVILLFLLVEPKGLVELWRRTRVYFDLWPFRYKPLEVVRR
jgi:branched-chain amino acid transport system permease protein